MTREEMTYDILNTIAGTGMTWWVSATVLCATILGVTWSKREDLKKVEGWWFHSLFALVMLFFLSICVFGVYNTIHARAAGDAYVDACIQGHQSVCLAGDARQFAEAVPVGVGIGTTSFIIYSLAWIGAWIAIARE